MVLVDVVWVDITKYRQVRGNVQLNTPTVCVNVKKVKVKVSFYIAQYQILRIAESDFYTLLPGKHVQSKTISASLGSIQQRVNFANTARTQICITVYIQVFIHIAE